MSPIPPAVSASAPPSYAPHLPPPFNPAQLPETSRQPHFFESGKVRRAVAMVFAAIAALSTVATVTAAISLTAAPTVVISVVCGFGLTAIVTSIAAVVIFNIRLGWNEIAQSPICHALNVDERGVFEERQKMKFFQQDRSQLIADQMNSTSFITRNGLDFVKTQVASDPGLKNKLRENFFGQSVEGIVAASQNHQEACSYLGIAIVDLKNHLLPRLQEMNLNALLNIPFGEVLFQELLPGLKKKALETIAELNIRDIGRSYPRLSRSSILTCDEALEGNASLRQKMNEEIERVSNLEDFFQHNEGFSQWKELFDVEKPQLKSLVSEFVLRHFNAFLTGTYTNDFAGGQLEAQVNCVNKNMMSVECAGRLQHAKETYLREKENNRVNLQSINVRLDEQIKDALRQKEASIFIKEQSLGLVERRRLEKKCKSDLLESESKVSQLRLEQEALCRKKEQSSKEAESLRTELAALQRGSRVQGGARFAEGGSLEEQLSQLAKKNCELQASKDQLVQSRKMQMDLLAKAQQLSGKRKRYERLVEELRVASSGERSRENLESKSAQIRASMESRQQVTGLLNAAAALVSNRKEERELQECQQAIQELDRKRVELQCLESEIQQEPAQETSSLVSIQQMIAQIDAQFLAIDNELRPISQQLNELTRRSQLPGMQRGAELCSLRDIELCSQNQVKLNSAEEKVKVHQEIYDSMHGGLTIAESELKREVVRVEAIFSQAKQQFTVDRDQKLKEEQGRQAQVVNAIKQKFSST